MTYPCPATSLRAIIELYPTIVVIAMNCQLVPLSQLNLVDCGNLRQASTTVKPATYITILHYSSTVIHQKNKQL